MQATWLKPDTALNWMLTAVSHTCLRCSYVPIFSEWFVNWDRRLTFSCYAPKLLLRLYI